MAELTGAAKVDNLDGTAFGVAQENVLWLQITVYDLQLWCPEEQQRSAQLLRKLARQVQRHSTEVGVTQQIVQVVRQELKDKEQMTAPQEMSLQFHCQQHTDTRHQCTSRHTDTHESSATHRHTDTHESSATHRHTDTHTHTSHQQHTDTRHVLTAVQSTMSSVSCQSLVSTECTTDRCSTWTQHHICSSAPAAALLSWLGSETVLCS